MNKNLIIVESANKIKSIQSYVGSDYVVLATGGHLRELNKNYGYNRKTFEPKWEIVSNPRSKISKQHTIDEIDKEAKNAENIFLATDPDREGEAIAWHIFDLLSEEDKLKCKRITFNEVTKKYILNAIENPRSIDDNLVKSQFTRRILDRLVGYKLSNLVKTTLKAISAGRVQSIALMFIVDRELERRVFVPTLWWTIDTIIDKDIEAYLRSAPEEIDEVKIDGRSESEIRFKTEADAIVHEAKLNDEFEIYNIDEPKHRPGPRKKPYTTDTLLQDAFQQLGWGTDKTTKIAQMMFEGVEINGEQTALISYPRTDSERMSDEFVVSAHEYIRNNYGEDHISNFFMQKPKSKKKQLNIQDAHEAIRPISVSTSPESIVDSLKDDTSSSISKLYRLIWTRTVAALMKPPIYLGHTIRFINNGYKFYTSYRELTFKGYLALPYYNIENAKNTINLTSYKVGDILKRKSTIVKDHTTTPPPYYNEGTLVGALKAAGVGRPSTYRTMTKIGQSRGYVTKEKQNLIPSEIGLKVIQELRKQFPDIISKKFTADMELRLDAIAEGKEDWKVWLMEFAPKFQEMVKQSYDTIVRVKDEKAGRDCPDCGKDLVIKTSRYNKKFIGCSGFPNCHFIEPLEKPKLLEELCPQCNSQLIERKNRRGETFIGCSSFPKCRFIKSDENRKKYPSKEKTNKPEKE